MHHSLVLVPIAAKRPHMETVVAILSIVDLTQPTGHRVSIFEIFIVWEIVQIMGPRSRIRPLKRPDAGQRSIVQGPAPSRNHSFSAGATHTRHRSTYNHVGPLPFTVVRPHIMLRARSDPTWHHSEDPPLDLTGGGGGGCDLREQSCSYLFVLAAEREGDIPLPIF